MFSNGVVIFCARYGQGLIADSIASIINPALARWQRYPPSTLALHVGLYLPTLFRFLRIQRYGVGLGAMFGIRLPQNFNSPYKAIDISDFWKRGTFLCLPYCAITFTSDGWKPAWGWSTCRNVMVTMLLGGLWHGANWTFVVWGAYHGLLLVATRYSEAILTLWPTVLESDHVRGGDHRVGSISIRHLMASGADSMFSRNRSPPGYGKSLAGLLLIAGALAHFGPNTFELPHRWRRSNFAWYPAAGVHRFIYGGQQSPFLYFSSRRMAILRWSEIRLTHGKGSYSVGLGLLWC